MKYMIKPLLAGALMPLAFAPFHCSGLAIFSLICLYALLNSCNFKSAFFNGLLFGIGYFGIGVSWIFVSIHNYGHLNYIFSFLLTFVFVAFISLYIALFAISYSYFIHSREFKHMHTKSLYQILSFSCLWVVFELLRSNLLTGFPWLLLGVSQMDSPLQHLLPIIGIYGVSFLTCFIAGLFYESYQSNMHRVLYPIVGVVLLLSPLMLKNHQWTKQSPLPISTGVVQSNLSMKDKWDETLFWKILKQYYQHVEQLLGTQLIVLPESAIPLPYHYISEFLQRMDSHTKQYHSGLIFGIPEPTSMDETYYYNTVSTLGDAHGLYFKQHIVPFGEYIPQFLSTISDWLQIENPGIKSGPKQTAQIKLNQHPMATLLCYELAYGNLLRYQLPQAEWILSLSEDGWFGHSLAIFQQQQMAQVLAKSAGRYHIFANNAGLSSIIDANGQIQASLPPFTHGVLKSSIYPHQGMTPWVYWGDNPILFITLSLLLLLAVWPKTRYSRQP